MRLSIPTEVRNANGKPVFASGRLLPLPHGQVAHPKACNQPPFPRPTHVIQAVPRSILEPIAAPLVWMTVYSPTVPRALHVARHFKGEYAVKPLIVCTLGLLSEQL